MIRKELVNPIGDKMILADFKNIHELIEYNKGETSMIFAKYPDKLSAMKQSRYDTRFTGTESYEQALQMLEDGWIEKAKELEIILKKIEKGIKPDTKRQTFFDVAGYQCSVPRFLQDLPTSMINQKMIVQKNKIVTLNKTVSYSAGVSAKQIEEECIKAMRLIKAIEAKNYRVKLNTIFAAKKGKRTVGFRVCLKAPNERMNLGKLTFPLVHPSFLRRICLRFEEIFPDYTSAFVGSYGYPVMSNELATYFNTEYFIPEFIDESDLNKNIGEYLSKLKKGK